VRDDEAARGGKAINSDGTGENDGSVIESRYGKLSVGQLFLSYLRDNPPLRFPAVLLVLLAVLWWLQDLPWQPMAYVVLLTAAVSLAGLGINFMHYVVKYRKIEEWMRQAEQGAFLTDSPERTDHGMDGAWLALVSRWQQNCLDEMERGRAKREESSRYYTLWSHQIKTPVAAAHLLLQEETLDRPAMEQELFKMEQYVDMALQYQRLDKSGRDLVLQEYELEGLVKKAVKGLAAVFIYNRAALELGELAGQVLTDEKWFVFVLEQILSNAVKYAPKGKISVYLSGDRKELVIEDNGIGIRPEDIPRVFEWGYTGSNGRLEKRSTGIGLYLCRQVMNMLGQSIRIESEEGVGTRVCLGIDRYRFGVE